MELVLPSLQYRQSWQHMLEKLGDENTSGFWNFPQPPSNLEEYIRQCSDFAAGKNLQSGWVANTTYWLIDKNEWVGHVNIRHALNEYLLQRGGHIGYAIYPSKRGQGYGKTILQLAIQKARNLGIDPILVTCNETNIASQKIIESNGGVLQDSILVETEQVRRYWI